MKNIIPLVILTILLNSCSENKIIYIADHFADCESVSDKKCFKFKESQEEEWKVLANEIEGFDYQEGNSYKIEVNIKKIKNPTANGSNLRYKLVRIIYQQKKMITDKSSDFQGKWEVHKMVGFDSLTKSPTLIIDAESKKISGNAGCNKYGVSYTTDNGELYLETPFATKMYCTNMKIEQAFFECLSKVNYYKLENGNLRLFSKDHLELLSCSTISE